MQFIASHSRLPCHQLDVLEMACCHCWVEVTESWVFFLYLFFQLRSQVWRLEVLWGSRHRFKGSGVPKLAGVEC